MGKSDDTRPSKPEKPSSPPQDQPNVHVYPDWAAVQAYYGPRVPVPPYFNSAATSGHAPHPYMWGPPQHMMPPYGPPYAAIYAHGGVYAHPGVPLAGTPFMETPTKSSGHTDQGTVKKLKGFDGLAMSIGNSNANSADGGSNHVQSQSLETETSSDTSNGNTAGAGRVRKRSHKKTPTLGGDGKTETHNSPDVPPGVNKAGPAVMPPNEAWLQNERELKRERRKQSNRESARRSRLRRQAEAEELSVKVESLNADNMTLKSEISRLTEISEKLKLENASLMDKMKNAKGGRTDAVISTKVSEKRVPGGTENLLSRVNNSGSVDGSDEGNEMYEKSSKSGTKLHQLLDASPRADAVAAR
ncbi:common plant regulatory factor 1 isoform X1 [Rhododendron vialii]|uniref:common plant regulatory factor 1 isoform X1 n=1 Tax=Rhododendron vialii TaxID=182163 RepID=UPI00265D8E89|nr:common plant regulatory factor 1 isoform X1 [Rhododendron vialii]XP_058225705.1 common plant regulatory factor 1 isoform X1 [Rhododendron vialii]XP_058225706.1 common plant regulatory factor 1 isoform X1 [Rhododendron vialii]